MYQGILIPYEQSYAPVFRSLFGRGENLMETICPGNMYHGTLDIYLLADQLARTCTFKISLADQKAYPGVST